MALFMVKLIYKHNIYMEVFSIISIILISGLILERIIKHFKKSNCCGSSVEFDTTASAPDFSQIVNNIKK